LLLPSLPKTLLLLQTTLLFKIKWRRISPHLLNKLHFFATKVSESEKKHSVILVEKKPSSKITK
jgi:hypothetical protein